MTGTTPHEALDPSESTDGDATAPPRRTPVFEPAPEQEPAPRQAREPDPYPAATRPTFDIPVSAPVSAHAPVVLERISAPSSARPEGRTPVGEDDPAGAPHGDHAALRSERRGAPRDPGAPASTSHASGPERRPARAHRAAIIVLSTLLVLALGAGAYLVVLSNEWEQRSGEWEAQSRDLGSDVADLTGDIAGMTSELTIVRDQLATAQTRITELADEKAQVGDDRESQRILADDVQEVAETALDVSAALGDCITAQNTVLGYLAAPETATPEVLQTAVTQADTVCTAAVADYNSLQQDLADS